MRLEAMGEVPLAFSRDLLLLSSWLLAPLCAVVLLVCCAPLDVIARSMRGGVRADDLALSSKMMPLLKESASSLLPSLHRDAVREKVCELTSLVGHSRATLEKDELSNAAALRRASSASAATARPE